MFRADLDAHALDDLTQPECAFKILGPMEIVRDHVQDLLVARRTGALMPLHYWRQHRDAVFLRRKDANGFRFGKRLKTKLTHEAGERAKILKRFAAVPDLPVMNIAAVRAARNVIRLRRELLHL